MPIRCYQRSKGRGLPVILVHFLSPTASIFPHLCPQKEMLHRPLDHVNAIERDLASSLCTINVLLSFAEERALVSCRAFAARMLVGKPKRR